MRPRSSAINDNRQHRMPSTSTHTSPSLSALSAHLAHHNSLTGRSSFRPKYSYGTLRARALALALAAVDDIRAAICGMPDQKRHEHGPDNNPRLFLLPCLLLFRFAQRHRPIQHVLSRILSPHRGSFASSPIFATSQMAPQHQALVGGSVRNHELET